MTAVIIRKTLASESDQAALIQDGLSTSASLHNSLN